MESIDACIYSAIGLVFLCWLLFCWAMSGEPLRCYFHIHKWVKVHRDWRFGYTHRCDRCDKVDWRN